MDIQHQEETTTTEKKELNGVGSSYREPSLNLIDAAIERALATERERAAKEARKPQAAASPIPDFPGGSLWALVPKNQRPLVVIALMLFTGGSGSWLLNLSAIWSLPGEVKELKTEITAQKEQLQRIESLLTKKDPTP